MIRQAIVLSCLFLAVFGGCHHQRPSNSFLPPNNLDLQDSLTREDAQMSQQDFNAVADGINEIYKPLATLHGAQLQVTKLWDDATVNASAEQNGTVWNVNMYGGLARRPEVTKDGFAMVVCHELGHHFGGFAFYEDDTPSDPQWAAAEGQADYFATQACAKKIWSHAENGQFGSEIPAFAKNACDGSWVSDSDRGVCYRVVAASQSLANLLAALSSDPAPKLETPSAKRVQKTDTSHPEAQCRLDTYFQAALCAKAFDEKLIPGRLFKDGQDSVGAEKEAYKASCGVSEFKVGLRPGCWFKAKVVSAE